jgi:hypothetical protein
MNVYPDNTLTKYTTKLHNEISLQGEWEVGLSEIIFPKNWLNIREDQTIVVYMYALIYPPDHPNYDRTIAGAENLVSHDRFVRAIIPKGYYKDVSSLVNELNKQLNIALGNFLESTSTPNQFKNRAREEGYVQFRFDTNTNLVSVYALSESEMRMPNDLIDMLGFSRNDFPIDNEQANSSIWNARRMTIVDSDRQTLYVYCDVVECVPVGDSSAPLLRVVDVDSSFRNVVHKSFDQPRYIALRKMSFESLEIDIRDGLGRSIPFEDGTVIVTLHFKRANSSYLLT